MTADMDQVWKCPRCGSLIGTGGPGRWLKPPACVMGHEKAEMERTTELPDEWATDE